ncbi:MAG: biopolymer transporter ExbD [Planctomycetota bacterium]|nr:biopolymer transporter ExbD [Planctomycetota bacterium]
MPIRTQPLEEPAINLTPMIDVILVLIIFFMVATKFTEEERNLDLKLPTVATASQPTTAPDPKIVNVQQSGAILLGKEPVTLTELTQQLTSARAQYKRLNVLIRGDQLATHGQMAAVYDACKQAGIAELAISVRLDTAKR